MSKLNHGAVRLRLITLLLGTLAIAAGVYAGYTRKTTESCLIVPSSIYEGKAARVVCTDLNAFVAYAVTSNGDNLWNVGSAGTGDGSSAVNCIGLETPYFFSESTDLDKYFCTTDSGTDATTGVILNTLDQLTVTNNVPAYKLAFTGTSTSVSVPSPMTIRVQNLVGNNGYYFGEVTAGGSPTNVCFASYAGGFGAGTSLNPFKVDSSSPYMTRTLSYASSGLIGTPVYILTAATGSSYLGVYDSSGTLIGMLPFTCN